ncbi:hypothetical protein J6590_103277 [Homalodisca vitripennis]|nr:hypothetical protein J6590_103277 [Homalodisca vitripennis]
MRQMVVEEVTRTIRGEIENPQDNSMARKRAFYTEIAGENIEVMRGPKMTNMSGLVLFRLTFGKRKKVKGGAGNLLKGERTAQGGPAFYTVSKYTVYDQMHSRPLRLALLLSGRLGSCTDTVAWRADQRRIGHNMYNSVYSDEKLIET